MTDKRDDRKATPTEAEELKLAHLRDTFFVDTNEPAVISERLRDAKVRRHYWKTMHAVTDLFHAMPMNERVAWINWLRDRFVPPNKDLR